MRILKYIRNFLAGKKQAARPINPQPANRAASLKLAAAPASEWAAILAGHVGDHFEEVPGELIAESFHHFSQELHAPLNAMKARIAEIDKELTDGFALIKAVAPELAHRALTRTPLELEHYIEPAEVWS